MIYKTSQDVIDAAFEHAEAIHRGSGFLSAFEVHAVEAGVAYGAPIIARAALKAARDMIRETAPVRSQEAEAEASGDLETVGYVKGLYDAWLGLTEMIGDDDEA